MPGKLSCQGLRECRGRRFGRPAFGQQERVEVTRAVDQRVERRDRHGHLAEHAPELGRVVGADNGQVEHVARWTLDLEAVAGSEPVVAGKVAFEYRAVCRQARDRRVGAVIPRERIHRRDRGRVDTRELHVDLAASRRAPAPHTRVLAAYGRDDQRRIGGERRVNTGLERREAILRDERIVGGELLVDCVLY